jgi:hypothetical protein
MSEDIRKMIDKVKNFKQFVNENVRVANFDVLYHGTTIQRYNQIKKRGFDTEMQGEKSGYGSVLGISLTANYEIAKEHAEWAVEKFGGEEYVITVNSNNLKIMNGSNFAEIDNDYKKAYSLYEKGLIDGVELCDMETGDGCEEFEIFIFNVKKLNQLI